MQETSVTAKVSFYELILALEVLGPVYPVERLSFYQIESLEAAVKVFRDRLEEFKKTAVPAKAVTDRRIGPENRRTRWKYSAPSRRVIFTDEDGDSKGRRKTDTTSYLDMPRYS